MARRSISIDEKVERQKEISFALKDKYEAAVAELDALIQKKKELLKAIQNSKRSTEEIIAFLEGKNVDDDEE